MAGNQRKLSLRMYYLLVANLSNLVLIAAGWALLALIPTKLKIHTGNPKLDAILVICIVAYFIFRGIWAGVLITKFEKYSSITRIDNTKFIGLYLGRFYFELVGMWIGAGIAGFPGLIIGAVVSYFVGRWIGEQVGMQVGHLIDTHYLIEEQPEKIVQKIPLTTKWLFTVLAVIYPWFMVWVAFSIKRIGFVTIDLPPRWLPVAKIFLIAITIYSLAIPWWLIRYIQKHPRYQSSFSASWFGLLFSTVIVLFGLFFYLIIPSSILIVVLFAAISSGLAFYWGRKAILEF